MYEQYLLAKKVARYSLRNVLMFCSHQFILHPEFIFARKLQKYNIHALCGLFLSEQNIVQGDKIVWMSGGSWHIFWLFCRKFCLDFASVH